MRTCGHQFWVPSSISFYLVFEAGTLNEPRYYWFSKLSDHQALEISSSRILWAGIAVMRCTRFYTSAEDTNSSPKSCTGGTWLRHLSHPYFTSSSFHSLARKMLLVLYSLGSRMSPLFYVQRRQKYRWQWKGYRWLQNWSMLEVLKCKRNILGSREQYSRGADVKTEGGNSCTCLPFRLPLGKR